jgi:hypothetical protein
MLDTPNDAFGGLKPLEVIERGEIDRLWNMIFYLESGVPSVRLASRAFPRAWPTAAVRTAGWMLINSRR